MNKGLELPLRAGQVEKAIKFTFNLDALSGWLLDEYKKYVLLSALHDLGYLIPEEDLAKVKAFYKEAYEMFGDNFGELRRVVSLMRADK